MAKDKSRVQIMISPAAYAHLELISKKYKSQGFTEKSMKSIASDAILCLPVPNGSKPCTDEKIKEEK